MLASASTPSSSPRWFGNRRGRSSDRHIWISGRRSWSSTRSGFAVCCRVQLIDLIHHRTAAWPAKDLRLELGDGIFGNEVRRNAELLTQLC